MPTAGLVALGHAPRLDITDDIRARLPDDVDILEVGALDAYDDAETVTAELGAKPDQPVYVTSLRDGSTVLLDRDATQRAVGARIADIEADVDAVGILCTGTFPHIEASVPVLETGALLRSWGDAIAPEGTLGVLMPKAEQAAQIRAEWSGERDVRAVAASPYDDGVDVRAAAADLGDVDLVLLKCMSYRYETKRIVREVTGAGVLLPKSLLTKAITELLVDEEDVTSSRQTL